MAVDALQIERLVALHGGHDVVVFDVDGQQAECRDVARVRRDQRGPQPENVDEPARLQRPRAAKRDQHVVAHVQPASDRDLAHGARLAIEPPPAPTVTTSVIGTLTGCRPTRPSVVTCGAPCSTTATSVLVPPPSSVRTRSKPAA